MLCLLYPQQWNKFNLYKWTIFFLNVFQGNIVKWNFKEGDKVDVGDQICDIETDKATLGFEMQDAGYIAKILVADGTKGVPVGTVIISIYFVCI